MKERLRQEDGIALLLALGMSVALAMLVFATTQYVTSNQKSAQSSNSDAIARSYAEAALNTAYSRIQYANSSEGNLTGLNPSLPTLLGCGGSNGDGSSNCSTVTPLCVSIAGACPTGTYMQTVGTATVSGAFTGTSTTVSYGGYTGAASQWILVATGYARNASGKTIAKTLRGLVTVSGADSGAVASVWNHVFLTKPATPGVCQTSFFANGTTLDTPLYVIGNLCFLGNTVTLQEISGGQAVDLQVGGRFVFGGNGDAVGTSTQSVTSAVVVGDCATSISGATRACSNTLGSWGWYVGSVGSFVPQSDPELDDADVMSNYSNFDPGPKHTCATGTSPSPLAANAFDSSIAAGEGSTAMPGNSGSVTSGTPFNLTPSSSYACISTSGTSKGYLIWNNNSSGNITVSGITVGPKQLAVYGSIYFDSPLNVTQTMTYKGTGIVMASGKVTFTTSNMTVCAQNTSCNYTNWQGTSGNNDMLTLATVLKNASNALHFQGNSVTYMGSSWASPTSTMYFEGNSPVMIGPVSVGSISVVGNSFKFRPLPIIKNMPVGAPVPPNVSASISPLTVIG